MPLQAPDETLPLLRKSLLGLFIFGIIGTMSELLLLKHFEDPWQFIPLGLLAVALVLALPLLRGLEGARMVRYFRALMVLFMIGGVVGVLLHYRASAEFKLETDPSLHGLALFTKAVTSEAPPALAPGNMILLGLLGLAALFRLDTSTTPRSTP